MTLEMSLENQKKEKTQKKNHLSYRKKERKFLERIFNQKTAKTEKKEKLTFLDQTMSL